MFSVFIRQFGSETEKNSPINFATAAVNFVGRIWNRFLSADPTNREFAATNSSISDKRLLFKYY